MSQPMSSETFSVNVRNLSSSVSRDEVYALFNRLIGGICKTEECIIDSFRCLVFTFQHLDGFKKALCMSGYMLAGNPMLVTPFLGKSEKTSTGVTSTDRTPRNLYVLGLPFDLTKSEFATLFAPFGTVSHCVILATRDSASRRRGFIVMSTHEEAKKAMNALSRKLVKGSLLDISWAVVQRSGGFLDGGDRAIQVDSRSSSQNNGLDNDKCQSGLPAAQSDWKGESLTQLRACAMPMATILVMNLPSALFSQLVDLQPLLYPFGCVKKLKILDPTLDDVLAGKLSVLVEYATTSSAKEAKEMLDGQFYAFCPIQVVFIQSLQPTLETLRSSLNPYAPPFVHEFRSSACDVPAEVFSSTPIQRYTSISGGFCYDHPKYPVPLGGAHPAPYTRRPIVSRSSSASSRLSNDSSKYVLKNNPRH